MATSSSKPTKLRLGDAVRLVSPASTLNEEDVARCGSLLEGLRFRVESGRHGFDRVGYLAGRDEERLADLNDALIRAIIATCQGKGAYRIADGLDFVAMQNDPKLLIGFSEIAILHLAVLGHTGVPEIHGACWDTDKFGEVSARSFRQAILTAEAIAVGQFTSFSQSQGWIVVDVLQNRLALLGVPILGSLPIGYGPNAVTVPIGAEAVLDADQGTLTIAAAVR